MFPKRPIANTRQAKDNTSHENNKNVPSRTHFWNKCDYMWHTVYGHLLRNNSATFQNENDSTILIAIVWFFERSLEGHWKTKPKVQLIKQMKLIRV